MLPNNLMARGWDCQGYRGSAPKLFFFVHFNWKSFWLMKRSLLNLGHSQGCPVTPILCVSHELHGEVFYSCMEAREGAEELLQFLCPCFRTSCVMVFVMSCGGYIELTGSVGSRKRKRVEKPEYLQATDWLAICQGKKKGEKKEKKI